MDTDAERIAKLEGKVAKLRIEMAQVQRTHRIVTIVFGLFCLYAVSPMIIAFTYQFRWFWIPLVLALAVATILARRRSSERRERLAARHTGEAA